MLNYNTLEKDIERLSQEIKEKKNLPEHKELSEKEILKQTLQPIVQQHSSKQDESVVLKQKSKTKKQLEKGINILEDEEIFPDYLNNSSDEEVKKQVERLIEIVFNQGLEKAIKEAIKSGGFVLDAFHDALTDKLYDEIKKRNLI
ncbi:hypothetical protein JW698_00565 [Candidatus Wolfebacteria bacterium]|nr:hypothetical protein [Candidatus Wolfebacteria bacterium]